MKVVKKKKESIAKKVENKKIKLNQEEVMGPDLQQLGFEIKKDLTPKKKKLVFFIILFFLFVVLFVCLHLVVPKIKLNGDSTIEISYFDTYQELGATAQFLGRDLTKKIKITENVDPNKIGTYQIVYSLKDGIFQIKKERTVKVVDKKAPVIELEGEEEYNVCPNEKFQEIGFAATDEYDGTLTEKVKIKETEEGILYTVEDSSHNLYSITRKIHYVDTIPPEITLKGNQTMYLTLNETYQEPGFTAIDNCSKDLTEKVIVTGTVSVGQIGTYQINYRIKDDAGNEQAVTRKVIVSEKTDPNSGSYQKGVIYLTFDDGPSNVTTGDILNVLKEEGVKATFFVTNNGPDYLIKRMYDEGHTVALHTASHNYSQVYASMDSYFNDLKIVSDRVKRITGQTSKIVRFPGGSSNTVSRNYSIGIMSQLSEALFSQGYRYYDWNIDSGDAAGANREKVYQNVTKNLSKNKMNIVLMHDIKIATRDAIRDIIHYGKENGYTFERIDMDTYMIRQRINN